LLRLTGDVQVVNASGTIDAGELVVNLATNVSTFTSGDSGGRVTGVFTSQ
jgi:lipopolysaccharide export system protein LptA